jgi:hypothetical protein
MTACSICGSVASYGPLNGAFVCDNCKDRIAVLASAGDEHVWSDTAVPDDALSLRFKEGVARDIWETDSESHANLAAAYREMMMYREAVSAAATSLRNARRPALILTLLEMLLSPPLLREGGLKRLRERLAQLKPG